MPISAVFCEKCKKYTCIGCRDKPGLGSRGATVQKSPEITVNNCCENRKLFGIWALLSVFDETELSVQNQRIKNAPKGYSHSNAGEGTGYASGWYFANRSSLGDPNPARDLSFSQ